MSLLYALCYLCILKTGGSKDLILSNILDKKQLHYIKFERIVYTQIKF